MNEATLPMHPKDKRREKYWKKLKNRGRARLKMNKWVRNRREKKRWRREKASGDVS